MQVYRLRGGHSSCMPVGRFATSKAVPLSKMAHMVEQSAPANVIAVDIGNSRMKLGLFQIAAGDNRSLLEPQETVDLAIHHETGTFDFKRLEELYSASQPQQTTWLIASVHRAAAAQLTSALKHFARQANIEARFRMLTYRDVPLPIRVDAPERVGIDRLIAALAANRLRQPDRAAIIIDLGTAITVDLLEADGAFAGGAILPGIATSARALEERTDALPRVPLEILDKPPAALGKSTVHAIESGIYWGAIGATQLAAPLPKPPNIFITGGASAHVAELLSKQYSVRHMPNLVLSGVALVTI
jgi:type III pantothenate kinase